MKPVADTRIAPAMSSLSMFFNDSLIVLGSLELPENPLWLGIYFKILQKNIHLIALVIRCSKLSVVTSKSLNLIVQ